MNELKYIPDSGRPLELNYANGYVVARVSGASGMDVVINTSQGFTQVGVSVDSMVVRGRNITIMGYILDYYIDAKAALCAAFRPLSGGVLWWEDKYWIRVNVAKTPELQNEHNAKFALTLFAPYPYWQGHDEQQAEFGEIYPMFSFPVNYETEHQFGGYGETSYLNCYNAGNLPTNFELLLTARGAVTNPSLRNIMTYKTLRFIGSLVSGDQLKLTHRFGRVDIEYYSSVTGDWRRALDFFDDSSDLFELEAGDNAIELDAESGASAMVVRMSWYDTFSGVYLDA